MAAKPTPSVLDDDIVSRAIKLLTEMQLDLGFYDEQFLRWGKEVLSGKERKEVERLTLQMKKLRAVILAILDLTNTLKEQTIEKILAMDDAELALKTLTDPKWPGIEQVLAGAEERWDKVFALERQVEPQMVHHFKTQPARNPLEALLLLVDEILGVL